MTDLVEYLKFLEDFSHGDVKIIVNGADTESTVLVRFKEEDKDVTIVDLSFTTNPFIQHREGLVGLPTELFFDEHCVQLRALVAIKLLNKLLFAPPVPLAHESVTKIISNLKYYILDSDESVAYGKYRIALATLDALFTKVYPDMKHNVGLAKGTEGKIISYTFIDTFMLSMSAGINTESENSAAGVKITFGDTGDPDYTSTEVNKMMVIQDDIDEFGLVKRYVLPLEANKLASLLIAYKVKQSDEFTFSAYSRIKVALLEIKQAFEKQIEVIDSLDSNLR